MKLVARIVRMYALELVKEASKFYSAALEKYKNVESIGLWFVVRVAFYVEKYFLVLNKLLGDTAIACHIGFLQLQDNL